MATWTILIVDDDALLRRSLEVNLLTDGYAVMTAPDGETALERLERRYPDAAILDLMLPDMTGFDLALRLRRTIEIPILMLTSVSDEATTIEGLQHYADDYVTKPFSYGVLKARLERLLARFYEGGLHPGERAVVDEHLTVDFGQRIAWVEGQPVSLTPIETRILFLLMQRRGQVVPTATLLRKAWGWDQEGDPESLWVRIRQLRKKLELPSAARRYIHTVRGVGYRFEA
ncbi:response regulator transcription factor [Kallotenue papyrolyticum]|uniref:response regulator transcription factor n=1 Tax=Kallotenue papyrolyticum TaxID=1325125 RepID=UPI0004785CB5|nr:response regulator transcription factor [Kallotenue papyrolyticum]